jgi:phosphopantetheinyl transferase
LWARSRGVLRELLGRYLDADPRTLRLEVGPHGKPALEGGAGVGSNLRFNLSHSGELMLVAVTAGREVGVDVERARERYTAEFLRAWTLHEATVKCLGTGLATEPVAGDGASDGLWRTELDVGSRAFAALAVELTPPPASAPRSSRGARAGCPPGRA